MVDLEAPDGTASCCLRPFRWAADQTEWSSVVLHVWKSIQGGLSGSSNAVSHGKDPHFACWVLPQATWDDDSPEITPDPSARVSGWLHFL